MMKSLFTAATGMNAQQTQISVISNNLANLSTTGFKQSKAVFQDLLYETKRDASAEGGGEISRPSPLQVGSGVQVVSTSNILSQGALQQTGRDLDVAIEGNGFLQVEFPPGSGENRYTRAGSLGIDANGNLVTQSGAPVVPSPGNFSQFTNITIETDGSITGLQQGSEAPTTIGTLQLVVFPNSGGLKNIGQNLFEATDASGDPTIVNPGEEGAGQIRQGFLEGSNVNVAEELINMVLAQRAFELNSKVIRTSDDMMSAVNQVR